MPVYTYRREDGSTFDIQQKFSDDALTVCPSTGQDVIRIIQSPGIIFKGSGFYVTDNKNGSRSNGNGSGNGTKSESNDTGSDTPKTEAKTDSKTESKAEPKTEAKEAKTEKASEAK